MTEKDIDKAFNHVIQDNSLMDSIGVDRKTRYKYRHPEKQPTSIAKKLELLYKCDILEIK